MELNVGDYDQIGKSLEATLAGLDRTRRMFFWAIVFALIGGLGLGFGIGFLLGRM
jgi:hypothetical protein